MRICNRILFCTCPNQQQLQQIQRACYSLSTPAAAAKPFSATGKIFAFVSGARLFWFHFSISINWYQMCLHERTPPRPRHSNLLTSWLTEWLTAWLTDIARHRASYCTLGHTESIRRAVARWRQKNVKRRRFAGKRGEMRSINWLMWIGYF